MSEVVDESMNDPSEARRSVMSARLNVVPNNVDNLEECFHSTHRAAIDTSGHPNPMLIHGQDDFQDLHVVRLSAM